MSNKFWNNFEKKNIKFKIYDSSKIKKTSEKIIKTFNESIAKVGLMVGKVQSGKTLNYLGLMSLAFDREYDVIILFSGNIKELANQTYDRVKEYFESLEDVDPLDYDCEIYNESNYKTIKKLNNDIKYIFSINKNTTVFNRFNTFIEKHLEEFKKRRILIIDDEGDAASLDNNNARRAQNNKSDFIDKTKTNKLIVRMLNQVKNSKFLTVTATPFANLIMPLEEEISTDFIVCCDPGDHYYGLDSFHVLDRDQKIVVIHEEDVDESLLTPSMKEAIKLFILSSALNYKIDNTLKFSMLIHCGRLIKGHEQLGEDVTNYINDLRNISSINILNELTYIYEFKNEFENICKKYYYETLDDSILEIIKKMLSKQCKQVVINSRSPDKLNLDKIVNIIIGGDGIQRGITIPHLLTTYFLRDAKTKQADTFLQRARWFGYREKTYDHSFVFLPQNLDNFYATLAEEEIENWDRFKQLDGDTDKTFAYMRNLKIEKNKGTSPTRKTIMGYDINVSLIKARDTTVIGNTWYAQKHFFETLHAEKDFYKKFLNSVNTKITKMGTRSVKTHDLLSEDISKLLECKILKETIFIKKMNVKGLELKNIKKLRLVFMDKNGSFDEPNNRTIGKNETFTIFGRGTNAQNSDTITADRNLHMYNEDSAILLIYNILFSGGNIESKVPQLAYAFHTPFGSVHENEQVIYERKASFLN